MIKPLFHNRIQLKKNEIYKSTETCPICKNNTHRLQVALIQKNPYVYLLECPACRGCSASFMPKEKVLATCYQGYYDNNKNPEKITFHNPERLAVHLVKNIKINKGSNQVHILDYGGGDGSLAVELAKKLSAMNNHLSCQITVVDFIKSKPYKKNNIEVIYKNKLDSLDNKFDIVLASAVLEHIPQLHKILKRLFELINKHGYFYARTPYVNPFMKMFCDFDFTYPYHVHDLGASFWNSIRETFTLSDFRVLSSRPAIVETEFKKAPIMTLLSYMCKFPAFIEQIIMPKKNTMRWNFYVSWEVLLFKD